MNKSGWCMAPAGARPKHEQCRSACCHEPGASPNWIGVRLMQSILPRATPTQRDAALIGGGY